MRVNSLGTTINTFQYVENARLISRGRLTAALLLLRKELIPSFTPRYLRWLGYLPKYLFYGNS